MRLSGFVVCANEREASVIRQHLPEHIALTRAERGCLSFEVRESIDPLVWLVDEHFDTDEAFAAHQARVASSDWGRLTQGIERRYTITGGSA